VVATSRRTVSPPIRLKNRPPLASEVPSDNCCVRTGIVVSNSPTRLNLLLFRLMLMEKPSTLTSWCRGASLDQWIQEHERRTRG
jgi:hypothetical protein